MDNLPTTNRQPRSALTQIAEQDQLIAEQDRQIAMQQQRLGLQARMIAGLRTELDQAQAALLAKSTAITELQRHIAELTQMERAA